MCQDSAVGWNEYCAMAHNTRIAARQDAVRELKKVVAIARESEHHFEFISGLTVAIETVERMDIAASAPPLPPTTGIPERRGL